MQPNNLKKQIAAIKANGGEKGKERDGGIIEYGKVRPANPRWAADYDKLKPGGGLSVISGGKSHRYEKPE